MFTAQLGQTFLGRRWHPPRKTNTRTQLILLAKYKQHVLRELHDNMGHQGLDRTMSLIRERFYWPRMNYDVDHYVTKSLLACNKRNHVKRPEHLSKILALLTRSSLFPLTFYIFYIYFTRFAQAYATTSKSAKTVVDKLFNDYALKFGFLQRIHHDQGADLKTSWLLS